MSCWSCACNPLYNNATTKYTHQLLTCLPLPEMGRATGEAPGLSTSKPNQKSGNSAPASRERRQGGASRVRRKDRHKTPLSLVLKMHLALVIYHHLTTLIGTGPIFFWMLIIKQGKFL